MKKEFDALMQNMVPCPSDTDSIGSKWMHRNKLKSDSTLDKYKERFLTQGYDHVASIEYTKTFSSVVKSQIVRVLITLTLTMGCVLKKLDMNNDFLNRDL